MLTYYTKKMRLGNPLVQTVQTKAFSGGTSGAYVANRGGIFRSTGVRPGSSQQASHDRALRHPV
jgi:hypothetical protein